MFICLYERHALWFYVALPSRQDMSKYWTIFSSSVLFMKRMVMFIRLKNKIFLEAGLMTLKTVFISIAIAAHWAQLFLPTVLNSKSEKW